MKFVSHSTKETKDFAGKVLSLLKPDNKRATILSLVGDLGAGKTAFTQGLASKLEVKNTVSSPTFVISKRYKISPGQIKKTGFKHLVHFDFYRLKDATDLKHLGWDDLLADPTNLIVTEWPEMVGEGIPKWAKKINFSHLSDNERKISATWLK